MLEGLPLFHFFKCGNSYCGEHQGMRYILEEKKNEEGSELQVVVWPEPWCREKTDEELQTAEKFAFNQEGLDAGIAWLKEQYEQREEEWKAALEAPWDLCAQKAIEKEEKADKN